MSQDLAAVKPRSYLWDAVAVCGPEDVPEHAPHAAGLQIWSQLGQPNLHLIILKRLGTLSKGHKDPAALKQMWFTSCSRVAGLRDVRWRGINFKPWREE